MFIQGVSGLNGQTKNLTSMSDFIASQAALWQQTLQLAAFGRETEPCAGFSLPNLSQYFASSLTGMIPAALLPELGFRQLSMEHKHVFFFCIDLGDEGEQRDEEWYW